jgi:NTP pyrophosphatase (non-canonical NTP hydrolase)
MYIENQKTISDWATSVFGEPKSIVTIARRALDEMGELLIKAGAIEVWESVEDIPVDEEYEGLASEAADVTIILMQLCEMVGLDLLEEIDIKMKKNRERKWKTDGNGVGQHV